jgi:hypothetical protein
MPGGISWRQKDKRDRFIAEAVKAIQGVSLKHGCCKVSKETLALLIQRYIALYKPPTLPGILPSNKKNFLKLVEKDND